MTKPRENKLQAQLNDARKVARPAVSVTSVEAAALPTTAPVAVPAPQVLTQLQWDARMQRWTCYVDRDVLYQLHAYARKSGVSRARIVTEGIALWLKENGAV